MKMTLAKAMEGLEVHQKRFPTPCHESSFAQLFQHGMMEIEIYRPEGADLQTPHKKDEIYFIASGSGQFEHEGSTEEVEAGDVLFVAAGEHHRFVDFSEDFATWVVLYGPTGGE
jgi:mannose-6-phosphate isomerase-like protein (cupin superfamily)